MNGKVIERLKRLRAYLEKEQVDYMVIPTSDEHMSEYVCDYFKVREYVSGFNGSNGTLVISKSRAGLWTDGRYFLQAEEQLAGTGIDLFKMGEPEVPTTLEYLESNIKNGECIGFHGKTMSAGFGKKMESIALNKNAKINYEIDVAEAIWNDRPALPSTEGWVLDNEFSGEVFSDKKNRVLDVVRENGAEALVLSKLDDIMWLFNIRANDIAYNPVMLSYAYISEDTSLIFLQQDSLTKELQKYFTDQGIKYRPYSEIFSYIETEQLGHILEIDLKNVNFTLFKKIDESRKYVDVSNPTELLKARKNEIEQKNLKEIYLQDSVAVTKFIYWILHEGQTEVQTEVSAAQKIDDLRKEIPGFIDLSFPTISAYQEHAAIIHYEPGETETVLKNHGVLMVDSGGQYKKGTTDVTRTIALGPVSEELKEHYANVCEGMLSLQNAVFAKGSTGRNIDILARQPLWKKGLDYRHGTGHGVGYVLNVHEGPQNIRWKYIKDMEEIEFEDGMVTSNEPGYYLDHNYGIRIENIELCKTYMETEYGTFLHFEPLTYVPLDSNILDVKYLSKNVIEQINQYQMEVYQRISPYLSDDEKEWLKKYTASI